MSDFPPNTNYTAGVKMGVVDNDGMISLTSGAANVKGAYNELVASTDKDYHGFWIYSMGSLTGSHLYDVAIGAASSEVNILENLPGKAWRGNSSYGKFFCPLYIAKGSRVSARTQSTNASTGLQLVILPFAGTFETEGACSVTETLGADTTDSGGTQIDAGATINVKGAYVDFGGFDRDVRYIAIFCNDDELTQIDKRFAIDLSVGGAGSEKIFIPNHLTTNNAQERYPVVGELYAVNLPSGHFVKVRASSNTNGANDRLNDITLVGFS